MSRPIAPGRGRPIDQAKREAILDAAAARFLEDGYSACSIEGIAAQAGVSKVTIYNQFGGKEELFRAAIERECDAIRRKLLFDGDGEPIRDRLLRFGLEMHAFLFRPEMRQFERSVAAETERDPAVGRAFLEAGPRRIKDALAALLIRSRERGELQFEDADLVAEQFAGMVKGMAEVEWRFAGEYDAAKSAARVENAVETIMRAYGSS
ncbi:MAG TPA: TetR/AcrR family transcriptional regulator [Allosphingosinicella sp.]|nr:TetR/AcrR family transcriptional regulator [Allosphingosinicella sp.]